MHKLLMLACLAGGLFMGAVAAPALAAEEEESRLERIARTGILVAGYRETTMPFSYLSPDEPVGFGVDLTRRIAAELGEALGRPDLRIRWNAVTPSTRIPLISTKTVDLLCSVDTHTRAREAQLDFSLTFYVSQFAVVVPRELEVTSLADLAGRRVLAPAATTNETVLRQANAEGQLGIDVGVSLSTRSAVRQVLAGEADAVYAAAAVGAAELLRANALDTHKVVTLGGVEEPFACMLPNDDPAFKAVVDRVLADMMQSKEMTRLYVRWFESPIPPYNRALMLPINPATQQAYASPTDAPMAD